MDVHIEEGRDGDLRVLRLWRPAEYRYSEQVAHADVERVFEELLMRERFDVVHVQHTWLLLPMSLIRVARRHVEALCLTLHDAWLMCHQTHLLAAQGVKPCSGPETPRKCVMCFCDAYDQAPTAENLIVLDALTSARLAMGAAALEMCDVVTAPSRYLIERFEGNGTPPGRIEHAPLGLAPVVREAPKPRRERVFGFIGAISALKDPWTVVRALTRVQGDARLLVFGSGEDDLVEELQEIAGADPRYEYRGGFPPERLPGVLGEVDVVVMASHSENFPLVAREALSAGVPVIATRVGGLPEIVQEGTDGMLFTPGDDAELAACMQALVDDPQRYERLCASLRPIKTLEQDAAEWHARYAWLLASEPDAQAGMTSMTSRSSPRRTSSSAPPPTRP